MKSRLNNTVQTHRREKNLTQAELAEQVGVTRQTIISIEKGNYVPSVTLALKLAQVFDKTVEIIFIESSIE